MTDPLIVVLLLALIAGGGIIVLDTFIIRKLRGQRDKDQ
jgi:uncharacterized integral membrane protein